MDDVSTPPEHGLPAHVPTPPPPPPPPPVVAASSAPIPDVLIPAGAVISSRSRRLVARILDGILLLATLFLGYVIWSFVVWGRGQTPGKQLMGMYVHDLARNGPAGWWRMFLRSIVVDVVLVQISFGVFGLVSALWIFTNPGNQRLTDKMVNTVVLDGRPERAGRRWVAPR